MMLGEWSVVLGGHAPGIPSEGEILRIKGVLILKRNATCIFRDMGSQRSGTWEASIPVDGKPVF